MRLRRENRPGVEIWNDCGGCMCHELPMVFGDANGGKCSECGCPKTQSAFDRQAKPIAKDRETWQVQS